MENRSLLAFKVGLFFLVLFWFGFTLFQFGKILQSDIDVPFTDVPATVGLGLRGIASFLALLASGLSLVKRNFSFAHAITFFKGIILCEAAYWLLFFPSGIWGFLHSTTLYSNTFFILSTGLPCTVESIVLPTVLVTLFFKLNGKKSTQNAIKGSLIAAAVYLFVFWFNYTAQWWSEIYISGTGFLVQSRLYAFEFALTVGALLFLAIYTGIYAKGFVGSDATVKLDLRKVGAIMAGVGFYFDLILLFWVLFPDAGNALTVWPTFSIGHNVDLWMASLTLIGLPLLFSKSQKIV